MFYLTLVITFAAVSFAVWGIASLYFHFDEELAQERQIYSAYEWHRDRGLLAKSRPLLRALVGLNNLFGPTRQWLAAHSDYWSHRLNESGNPANLRGEEYMVLKQITPVLTAIFLSIVLSAKFPEFIFAVSAASFFLPDLWLRDEKKRRQNALLRSLPDSLDTLSLVVGSGLDFGEAIDVYISDSVQTPLMEEFSLVRSEMLLGKTRTQALENMAQRIDLVPIRNFSTAVIESTKLGTAMADTLVAQADELRTRRFMQAEEMGQKAALKIMAPLLILVVPNVFLILFAPLILSAF